MNVAFSWSLDSSFFSTFLLQYRISQAKCDRIFSRCNKQLQLSVHDQRSYVTDYWFHTTWTCNNLVANKVSFVQRYLIGFIFLFLSRTNSKHLFFNWFSFDDKFIFAMHNIVSFVLKHKVIIFLFVSNRLMSAQNIFLFPTRLFLQVHKLVSFVVCLIEFT